MYGELYLVYQTGAQMSTKGKGPIETCRRVRKPDGSPDGLLDTDG